jgi:hypothetical protein
MSEEKGLLTKEVENLAEEALDEMIKAKGITEVATDAAIRFFIPLIDNNLADKIRDTIKVPLREAGQYIADGDYEAAGEKFADALNAIVDIKGVDEAREQEVARKQFEVFVLLVQIALEKKAAA